MAQTPELAECGNCKEGLTLDPSNGKTVACEICNGLGIITPGLICHCGRSCADMDEDIPFCGLLDCFKALKEIKRLADLAAKYKTPSTGASACLVSRFHHGPPSNLRTEPDDDYGDQFAQFGHFGRGHLVH